MISSTMYITSLLHTAELFSGNPLQLIQNWNNISLLSAK